MIKWVMFDEPSKVILCTHKVCYDLWLVFKAAYRRYEPTHTASSKLVLGFWLMIGIFQLLVAGGGMYVEVFNRGVIPLAYGIKKKNKAGETNTYLDGIYLLFTYFTKPESIEALEEALKTDDDVIRSMSFKIRKRKY